MSRMKDYLMFLEEKGYLVINELTDELEATVPNIYANHIMNEYNKENSTNDA